MEGDEDTPVILEAAREARDRAEYERAVLEHFDRVIGYDVGFFLRAGLGPVVLGLEERVRASVERRFAIIQRELAGFQEAAVAGDGVGVDSEYFTRGELERTHFYREILRPSGGSSSMVGYFVTRGQPIGALVLGRTRGGRFRDAEVHRLSAALRGLTVAELATYGRRAALRPPNPAWQRLTPREREIVGYLRLGYTNRDIARACGTSFRTVRNQLSSVYEKLGAANRAEAVALTVGAEPDGGTVVP